MTSLEKILDEAGDLHLVDYRPILSKAFRLAKMPLVVETIQDYCQDIFGVEEYVIKEFRRKLLNNSMNQLPLVHDIVCKHQQIQKWLHDIYQLAMMFLPRLFNVSPPTYVWIYLFWIPVLVGDTCVRPFCRLRDPPECICGRPLIL